ncbi:hypothetical protein PENSPDRAFT_460124 [Peniophora sp. CONT]|nr:hypothetical protein PENSPDRAFT_460124 [Peniophora sp. CONT]
MADLASCSATAWSWVISSVEGIGQECGCTVYRPARISVNIPSSLQRANEGQQRNGKERDTQYIEARATRTGSCWSQCRFNLCSLPIETDLRLDALTGNRTDLNSRYAQWHLLVPNHFCPAATAFMQARYDETVVQSCIEENRSGQAWALTRQQTFTIDNGARSNDLVLGQTRRRSDSKGVYQFLCSFLAGNLAG